MQQVQEKETEDNCSKEDMRTGLRVAKAYLARQVDLRAGLGALGGGPVQAGLQVRLAGADLGARGGAAAGEVGQAGEDRRGWQVRGQAAA